MLIIFSMFMECDGLPLNGDNVSACHLNFRARLHRHKLILYNTFP